ncbi:MAG TPA: FkbM family methyltransferase [Candidatus Gastranaerophilales bacterium]|nr:FkbM family methyltransferase [Candidatus Gastranaerophilales bacterium]
MVSLTNYLPDRIRQNIRHPWYAIKVAAQNLFTSFSRHFLGSYSQHGEDIIFVLLLKGLKKGFYVDVGANDPEIISNTKYFYDRGWNGINIEPHPTLFEKICSLRERDTNINAGVAQEETSLKFYQVNEVAGTAGSTFDPEVAKELERKGYKISKVVEMPVIPLYKILDEKLSGQKIDFMSVDTEGFDLEVLKSNDWSKYRPKFVLVETVNKNKENIYSFMEKQGYKAIFENTANTIFKDQQ